MPQPGKVDEAVLRAFDAFLLTAHQYDIPVIFTFFAFLPETWGGECLSRSAFGKGATTVHLSFHRTLPQG